MAIDADAYNQAMTDYLDNADYQEAGSTAKGHAYMTAARKLIVFPEETAQGGPVTRFDKETLREEIEQARKWLESQGAGSGSTTTPSSTRHFSLENFRE